MTVKNDVVIYSGLGHAMGRSLVVFYAENGILGSQDMEWLQGPLNVLIYLLRWIGLIRNIARSKIMTC